jgi:hypothetical protein
MRSALLADAIGEPEARGEEDPIMIGAALLIALTAALSAAAAGAISEPENR